MDEIGGKKVRWDKSIKIMVVIEKNGQSHGLLHPYETVNSRASLTQVWLPLLLRIRLIMVMQSGKMPRRCTCGLNMANLIPFFAQSHGLLHPYETVNSRASLTVIAFADVGDNGDAIWYNAQAMHVRFEYGQFYSIFSLT
ncbi:hypothetical protein ACJIZ3_000145 [Penstemon smallii]|uniref:Uncharacterized protein n=1 Tax=Penstemon smallii TaxID=265156 RepID=A0ABD3R8E0_9LAMI